MMEQGGIHLVNRTLETLHSDVSFHTSWPGAWDNPQTLLLWAVSSRNSFLSTELLSICDSESCYQYLSSELWGCVQCVAGFLWHLWHQLRKNNTHQDIKIMKLTLYVSCFLTGWEEPGVNNQHLATTGKTLPCVIHVTSQRSTHTLFFLLHFLKLRITRCWTLSESKAVRKQETPRWCFGG